LADLAFEVHEIQRRISDNMLGADKLKIGVRFSAGVLRVDDFQAVFAVVGHVSGKRYMAARGRWS
jgi:predicted signal transduction protein with EAL and GGDEF domain